VEQGASILPPLSGPLRVALFVLGLGGAGALMRFRSRVAHGLGEGRRWIGPLFPAGVAVVATLGVALLWETVWATSLLYALGGAVLGGTVVAILWAMEVGRPSKRQEATALVLLVVAVALGVGALVLV